LVTVSDITGTRTLAYDNANDRPWRLTSETLDDDYFGDRVLSRLYDNSTVHGRVTGFQLGSAANPDLEMEQVYAYLSNVRFDSVPSTRDDGATSRTFSYAYLTHSALINALSIDGAHPFTATRNYESQRDLIESIETKWSTTLRTGYAFTYDAR